MTRKLWSLIILMVFLLIPAVSFSVEPIADPHPIFQEKNWTLVELYTDPLRDSAIETYLNDDGSYSMIVHKFFGEVVIKRYGAKDRKTDLLLEKWVQVEISGQWRVVKIENLKFDELLDSSGKRTAFIVIVNDDNGKEIVRREVKRKNIAPAAISEKEKGLIDKWVKNTGMNEYGDPYGSVYLGGTPLFDEKTGKRTDRYEYILKNHLDRPWLKNQK